MLELGPWSWYGDNAEQLSSRAVYLNHAPLGVKLEFSPLTYSGLSGVGDLITLPELLFTPVTGRLGMLSGRGERLEDIKPTWALIVKGSLTRSRL